MFSFVVCQYICAVSLIPLIAKVFYHSSQQGISQAHKWINLFGRKICKRGQKHLASLIYKIGTVLTKLNGSLRLSSNSNALRKVGSWIVVPAAAMTVDRLQRAGRL